MKPEGFLGMAFYIFSVRCVSAMPGFSYRCADHGAAVPAALAALALRRPPQRPGVASQWAIAAGREPTPSLE